MFESLIFVPLVYISIFVPVTYYFITIAVAIIIIIVIVILHCFGFAGSLLMQYELQDFLFYFKEEG